MANTVATSEKIRIRLKAYDHVVSYSITNTKGNRNNFTFSTQIQRFKRTIRNENT